MPSRPVARSFHNHDHVTIDCDREERTQIHTHNTYHIHMLQYICAQHLHNTIIYICCNISVHSILLLRIKKTARRAKLTCLKTWFLELKIPRHHLHSDMFSYPSTPSAFRHCFFFRFSTSSSFLLLFFFCSLRDIFTLNFPFNYI